MISSGLPFCRQVLCRPTARRFVRRYGALRPRHRRLHAVENLSLESEAGIVGGMCGVHFPDIGRLPVDRGHRLRLLAHRRLVHRFENLFAQFFHFRFWRALFSPRFAGRVFCGRLLRRSAVPTQRTPLP